MTSRWREIADRILAEVEDLNRVTARAVLFWRAAGRPRRIGMCTWMPWP